MTADTQTPFQVTDTVAALLGSSMSAAQQIALGSGLTAHVISDPGRVLDLSTHRAIYAALVPMTSESFGADQSTYWRQRSKEGYLERLAEFIMMADDEGRFVGWTGFHILRWREHTVIYLDSTGMVSWLQSRGAMRAVMQQRVPAAVARSGGEDRPVYITARSESPIFYRLMRSLVDESRIFPNPMLPISPEISEVGAALAEWLGQAHLFDSSTLTLGGAYEDLDELYGELPTTGDADLDLLFRDRLGPLDAYLIVARAQ